VTRRRKGIAGVVRLQAQRLPQRVREIPAGRVSLLADLSHPLGENLIRGTGQVRALRAKRWRRLGHVGQEHRHALVTLEWHPPGQQLVGHARQRVLIGAPVHGPALDLLRC